MPSSYVLLSLPENGGSVPFSRMTWNCSGESSSRHSASVFFTAGALVSSAIFCLLRIRCARDSNLRDDFDLDQCALGQGGDLDGRACGSDYAGRREVLRVDG